MNPNIRLLFESEVYAQGAHWVIVSQSAVPSQSEAAEVVNQAQSKDPAVILETMRKLGWSVMYVGCETVPSGVYRAAQWTAND